MKTIHYVLYHPQKKGEALMHLKIFPNARRNDYEVVMLQKNMKECLDDGGLKKWIWDWYNEIISKHVIEDSKCRITIVGEHPAEP